VIRICSKCGALLLDDTESCSFCSNSANEREQTLEPALIAAGEVPRGESPEPEWRVEVSQRLERYRERRGRLRPGSDESQSRLASPAVPSMRVRSEVDDEASARARQGRILRQRHRAAETERVEICVQSELDFSSSQYDRARPQTALVPVASLADRRCAFFIDMCFLAFTCAGFVGLFLLASRSAGGELTLEKTDTVVYFAIAYLFYALYFSIFVVVAGSTPGMQLRSLSIVRLDGSLPETRQLLWRVFGYLLSAATLMLGFFWSIWDEDRFTWHDRISQTYITAAVPLSDAGSLDVSASHHTFAHK
jgi:uncharacterized RDD family membrane protein YckC